MYYVNFKGEKSKLDLYLKKNYEEMHLTKLRRSCICGGFPFFSFLFTFGGFYCAQMINIEII